MPVVGVAMVTLAMPAISWAEPIEVVPSKKNSTEPVGCNALLVKSWAVAVNVRKDTLHAGLLLDETIVPT